MDLTLVVMAAGMGSRFGGLKQVAAVGPNGEAILDFSVTDAKKAGFNKVVFVIKHSIEKEFKETVGARVEKILPVEYVYQELDALPEGFSVPEGREKPWGTGHAILCCEPKVNTPFAVINADDFYGESAFKRIAEGLSSGDDYCMVGFRLANTVTENGTVSRGVCTVKDGYLEDVTEYTKIDSQCRFTDEEGNVGQLSPDTVVSMNMWGFTPDIFKYIRSDFFKFLDEKINVPKSEFYLPAVVDKLIKNGTKKAKVLVADDKWYGVTYKEDLPSVVRAIKALCDEGKYNF
ncbi:MAG: nucleotidyltransferase [Ruminococcaceae bacterium]|nr:nucleotidyltransferase [Oscillospiraceae bacterium]